MHFLFGLADHIYVMHWGQVIAHGTPAELRANPWVQRSNLGALATRCSTHRARIDTFYGETQALFGVSLEVGARRGGGAARRQRRRQDDDAALDPRPDAGAARPHPLRRRGHHPRADPRDRARAASAGCRTTGASSRRSRWSATWRSRARRTAFRAWSEKECFEHLQRARVPACSASARTSPAARCRWWRSRARCSARRAWCCSTSRARAWRRASCRT